ncbi:hypothetical protein ASQ44_00700 [Rickettsia rhipicephali]|nr:hypothetical protein ASQ44_00700 [Rickettsia rhipicephali]
MTIWPPHNNAFSYLAHDDIYLWLTMPQILYPIYLLAFAPKSSSLLKYTLKKVRYNPLNSF